MTIDYRTALVLFTLAFAGACSGEGGGESTACSTGSGDGDGPDGDETEAGCADTDTEAGEDAVTCPEYCTTFFANCDTVATDSYADEADCETQCASFAQGEIGVEEVDTLECRWSHAQEANNDEHCGEAALVSTSCTG